MSDFPITRWSHVKNVARGDTAEFNWFVELYREPLIAFIRGRMRAWNVSPDVRENVEDYVQDFLLRELQSLRVFLRADRDKGKFHNYLQTACKRFVISKLRKTNARRRRHDQVHKTLDKVDPPQSSSAALFHFDESLDDDWHAELEDERGAPDLAFERTWAIVLLFQALALWRSECQLNDPRLWNLFEARALEPFLSGESPPSYGDIYQKLGYKTAKKAADAITPAKRQIKRWLRVAIRERLANLSPASPGAVDDESWEHRVDEALEEFEQLLSRELQLRRRGNSSVTEHAENESLKSNIDRQALRRFLREQFESTSANAATPLMSGESTGIPDLSECDLYQIAKALAEEPRQRTTDELADAFRQQLLQSLQVDLFRVAARAEITDQAETAGLLVKSMSDVIHHPQPPHELLAMIKNFAKARRQAAEGYVANEISVAIYFACIAASLVARNDRLTRQSDRELDDGLRWLAQQSWVDTTTRRLADEALLRLPNTTPLRETSGD